MRPFLALSAVGLALATAACFSPKVQECAVVCGAQGACPEGTTCLADNYCHSAADDSLCTDNGSDASLFDAAADGVPADASPFDAGDPADAVVGCGDGIIESGNNEICDDNNTNSDDGCSDTCQVETGFLCVAEPSQCHRPPGEGQILITEIMKDPCVNTGSCQVNDPEGEWFEIFNPTGETYQLLNMVIEDDGVEQTVVNTPLAIAPGQHLVLGNNADSGTNGGVTVDYAYSDIEFILANNNDEIILREPFGLGLIDNVDYRDATFPDTQGASLSLSGSQYSSTSNNIGANWCDGVGVFGDGDLGTPGQMNPVCP